MPSGPRGVQLKPKAPQSCAWAEIRGLMLEAQSKWSVTCTCLSMRSQSCIGNFGSVPQRTAIKRFLNVRIACSAALRRCIFGGESWKLIELNVMNLRSMADASLSIRWSDGLSP